MVRNKGVFAGFLLAASRPDIGAAREIFVASQMRSGGHEVVVPEKGDLRVGVVEG